MPSESSSASTLNAISLAHRAYVSLMELAPSRDDPNLGGQFLYIGELDEQRRTFAVAANIAGAATLAASADVAALRQAQREGIIDFLVNSLDEALRILKNEVRKRQPVSVAVSIAPAAIENEMLERGVLPDLLVHSADGPQSPTLSSFITQGAKQVFRSTTQAERKICIWPLPAEYTQNLAAFDSMLAEYLPTNDQLNRRWLRLSPRYLGPAARRLRSIPCDQELEAALVNVLGHPLNHKSPGP